MATKKRPGLGQKGSGTGKNSRSWLPKLRGSAGEAKARASADADQRRAAGQAAKSIILSAKDVQGEYDAARVLMTTMGGVARPLTYDDLATFRYNVQHLQARYKGGIRARQVLDMSLAEDRERANKEIRMAVPVAATGGRVRFLTNAGPDSKVNHHHVVVDFMSYGAAAAGARGSDKGGKGSASWMRREPVRIECDCERWRYWFRYVATIGRFNAGRDETGYPKVRNPNLHGIACKHILRVMAEVESSGTVLAFLTKIIDKARAADKNRVTVQVSQKEAEELANKPGRRIRDVEATLRRRQAAREKAALARAAQKAKATKPKTVAAATRRAERESAEVLAARYNMTPAQVLKILSQAQKNR